MSRVARPHETGQGPAPLTRVDWWSSTILGVAIALTTATQLRVSGTPYGPGEVIIVLWVLAAGLSTFGRGTLVLSRFPRVFVTFWFVAFLALFGGWFVAEQMGVSPAFASRDAKAFALSAALFSLVVTRRQCEQRVQVALVALLLATTVPLFGLLCAHWLGYGSIGPLRLHTEGRFLGWSLNPNQTAFAVVLAPVFALHGLRRSERAGVALYAVIIGASISVGLATASDALAFAWATGSLALIGSMWVGPPRAHRDGDVRHGLTRMVALLAVAAAVTASGDALLGLVRESFESNYERGGQGSDRTTLWVHALQAIAHSPLVGLGPGAHSGNAGPFGATEAHNTPLDWTASTGLVGLAALVWLVIHVARRVVEARQPLGIVALLCLGIYACFHNVLRQPVGWVYIIALASLPSARSARRTFDRTLVAPLTRAPRAATRGGAAPSAPAVSGLAQRYKPWTS